MIRTLIARLLRRLSYWHMARRDAADWRTSAEQIQRAAVLRTWD